MKLVIDDDFLYAHMGKAEEAMLSAIPAETKLSHPFSKRFTRKMKLLLKDERRTPVMRRVVRYAKSAAAVFLVTLSVAFATTMSVEAYRVQFFSFVTTVWEELTSIVIGSDDVTRSDAMQLREPAYIPAGYTEVERRADQYRNSIIYCNADGNEIAYDQTLLTQGEYIFDTENAIITEVQMGEQMVTAISKNGYTTVYWKDATCFYTLTGSGSVDDMLAMAQSVLEN